MTDIIADIESKRSERFQNNAQVDCNTLLVNEMYIRRLGIELEEKKEELVKKNEEREAVKADYLEHSKKRKVLDKLKERRESEYYKDRLREDFKEMDELSSSSYIRQAREPE